MNIEFSIQFQPEFLRLRFLPAIQLRNARNRLLSLAVKLWLGAVLAIPSPAETVERTVGNPSFVHLVKADGIWWFAAPSGEKFISLGVNHVEQSIWLAPYNREATLQRYGKGIVDPAGKFNPAGPEADRWAQQAAANLKEWGFNTFGVHVSNLPLLKNRQLFYCPSFKLGEISRAKTQKPDWPDVFSPDFAANVNKLAASFCPSYKNDPWVLGYQFSDMPSFNAEPLGHGWVLCLLAKDARSAAKQFWINLLRERYPDASAVSAVYGLSAKSWEEMARVQNWSRAVNQRAAAKDMELCLKEITDRWIRIHAQAVRKHDPNHLILGDKVAFDSQPRWDQVPPWLPGIMAKHVDVINIQFSGRIQHQQTFLINLHQACGGKPILNGDAGFNVKKKEQSNAKCIKTDTYDQMGREYEAYLHGLMALSFMVGWHHCGYMETWDGSGRPGLCESGFLNPFEAPYTDALKWVIPANQQAVKNHRESIIRVP